MAPRVPHALFDYLTEKYKLKCDLHLAAWLGSSAPHVSCIRRGHRPFGAELILRVHEQTGLSIKRIKEMLA